MKFQDTILAQGDLIKQLKQRNYNLVVENEFLKDENAKLKKEIVDLKTEIVDHRVKEYRLTKILNETSDYK
ncbi:hypothetical protein [Staphylococcus phage PT1-9]